MPKKRYFVLVSHCLLNPATRVHILGRRFHVAKLVCEYFLSKNIAKLLDAYRIAIVNSNRLRLGEIAWRNIW